MIKNMSSIRFTKKEKDFLIDWLSDDLDIQIRENLFEVKNLTLIKLLKSIIKKLKTNERK